jgi:hypothetical protein
MGDFMKVHFAASVAFIFIISGSLFAQSTATVEYLQNLSKAESATVGDAVKLFSLQSGKGYQNFDSSSSSLKQEGILPDKQYSEQDSLSRGLLAFMVTRYLKLTDSLWFNLFGAERYAYNACASAKIMPEGKSEWDKMSGPDLIEMLGKISERMEGEE